MRHLLASIAHCIKVIFDQFAMNIRAAHKNYTCELVTMVQDKSLLNTFNDSSLNNFILTPSSNSLIMARLMRCLTAKKANQNFAKHRINFNLESH